MIIDKSWHNSVDLGAIVQDSHAIESHSGYVLDPMPSVKGVGIQEGSWCSAFYALGVLSLGTFGMVAFP